MNIEVLQDHINAFTCEIVDSGFKRDIDDYINSLPNLQQNIVSLRDIAGKISQKLEELYNGELPASMTALLPSKSSPPFTDFSHADEFKELIEHKTIPQDKFFNQLNSKLQQLKKQLHQNFEEVNRIREFILPYLSKESTVRAEAGIATLSILFKEKKTISSLKQLTRTLGAWSRTLPLYHQLLKSDPPEDIQIVEVQNGSIDVIINLNMDVAINLADLFKTGFHSYVAYLTYKDILKPITATYRGNKKLLQSEEEREQELLNNISIAITNEIKEQHNRAKKADKNIEDVSIQKKVEQITALVTSHIIKGNDIKLLAVPASDNDDKQENTIAQELRSVSAEARKQLSLLPAETRQMLLDKYSALPDEGEKTTSKQNK